MIGCQSWMWEGACKRSCCMPPASWTYFSKLCWLSWPYPRQSAIMMSEFFVTRNLITRLRSVKFHSSQGLGVATCWIGPGTDHQSVIAALGPRFNQEEDHICCVCALGYASRYIPRFIAIMQGLKSRLPLHSLFFVDAEQPGWQKGLGV